MPGLRLRAAVLSALAVASAGCGGAATSPAAAGSIGYSVIRSYPHDPSAFTEGLAVAGTTLYESTGRYRMLSTVRVVDLATGRVRQLVQEPQEYFGEGLTAAGDHLVQLTWTSQVALLYDRATLRSLGRLPYQGEGWGLTNDGRSLVMSDGSEQIAFRDPATLQVRRTIRVTEGGRPVTRLNELEWFRGAILANTYLTDDIVRIDPATGAVTGRLHLGALNPHVGDPEAVLNGIAYDPAADRLLVTGKLWPSMYEIRLRG